MLALRYARQSRSLILPPSATTTAALSSAAADPQTPLPSVSPLSLLSSTKESSSELRRSDVTAYFREWFMSRKVPLYESINESLRAAVGSDAALSRIDVGVSEELVLGFLKYNCNDVLSCMKFFDWAGRQPGFFHTRATFTAIFKIISKAKLKNLVVDFLENYSKHSYRGKRLYHNVLVIGYSIAGQCESALNVFVRMRLYGLDLDRPAYNVLLNSLVDKGLFEFADCLSKEIRCRGYTDRATNSIMIKSYCKRNDFERAEEYRRSVVEGDMGGVDGYAMSTFITALCKSNQLQKASALMEEFKTMMP